METAGIVAAFMGSWGIYLTLQTRLLVAVKRLAFRRDHQLIL